MKKLVLSLSVIVLFAFYSIFQKKVAVRTTVGGNTAVNIPTLPISFSDDNEGSRNPTARPVPTATATLTPTTTTTPITQGLYKDGVYTGGVADAFYGNIQVQATIQGGRITDVAFLQYPSDRSRSIEINSQAMPYLRQEAIAVQSANVNIISGATATSQAFVASLGSALSQAK